MKNNIIALLVILGIILTFYFISNKNYKTVDEYYQAMRKVQQGIEYYTIEVEQSEQSKNRTMLTKVFVKGNKFRGDIISHNGKERNASIYLFENRIVIHEKGESFALINPIYDMLDMYAAKKPDIPVDTIKQFMTNMTNPTYVLFNWNEPFADEIDNLFFKVEEKEQRIGEFVEKKSEKNGFRCRLIKYTTGEYTDEVCVSDNYGIAVYYKINTPKGDIEWNVKNISTAKFDEKSLDLPQGVKLYTFADIMRMAIFGSIINKYGF